MIVGKDEDLEAAEHGHILRELSQLVGAEVELHHVQPCPNVDGERGQLVLLKNSNEVVEVKWILLTSQVYLHVQFLKEVCPRENAIGDSASRNRGEE